MSQADQGVSTDNFVDLPLKRKRGRPRKYPKLNIGDHAHISKNRGKKHLESIPVPPGYGMNGNRSQPVKPVQKAADEMLGQVVSGVIEAVFEAGYLLCVKVGNSGITLRGVVFKPGHYVPVSAENDVAPDVQMIRRNTFSLATRNYTQTHRHNHRSKSAGTNSGSKHTPHHSNQEASKDKTLSLLSTQITLSGSSRGNVVPVVLQPAKLTNGLPVATESFAIQTTHMATSKGKKEVLMGTLLSKESAPPNVSVGAENLPFQPQTSQQVLQDDASMEKDSHDQSSAVVVYDADVKTIKLHSTPFESLVTEVIKRIQAPSLSAEAQTENIGEAGKIPAKESEDSLDVDNLLDVPLMIEPLKAVQPAPQDSSVSIPKALDSKTGKMTELLQVLQQNMMQNQEPWAEVQNPVLIVKPSEEQE